MELQLSSSASDSIEREAESFLQNLNAIIVEAGTIDLKEFRNQYESLFVALKQSSAREIGIVEEYQELKARHDTTVADLDSVQSSNKCISSKVETLQSLLESANARECSGTATIRRLEEELHRVTTRLAESEIATVCRENEIKQLLCDVAEWRQKAATADERINSLEVESHTVKSQCEQLQTSQRDLLESNCILKERISEKNAEIARESERRVHVQQELESAQSKLQVKTQEFIDLQYAASVYQSKASAMETSLEESKKIAALMEQELDREKSLSDKLAKSKSDQKEIISAQVDQISQIQFEHAQLLENQSRMMSEKAQLEHDLEAERQAVLKLEKLVDDINAATRLSNGEALLLAKEVENLRSKDDEASREISMLHRDNELQVCHIRTLEDIVRQSESEIQEKGEIIESKQRELAGAKDATIRQELFSCSLEGECNKLRQEVEESEVARQRIINELKSMECQTIELKKSIAERRSEVEVAKQGQELIRHELNDALKVLADAQNALFDAEQERKIEQQLTCALQSQLLTKDSELEKEKCAYREERAQNELYSNEISHLKVVLSENEASLRTQQVEVMRLHTSIREIEEITTAQTKECDRILKERDILGSSLIRRNDEIALLYEKNKILQNNRCRGELQYNARLDDIRILKIKMRDLKKRMATTTSGQAGVEDLSRTLTLVQKELIRAKLKVKAMSDELENPLNVHRWHTLEGSDPQAYDMIQKIQILQKRLLQKTEEVMVKNSVIQEQERQQTEMKKILARQPGPEIVEQLHTYQQDVTKKVKQMKAMAGELNMNQTEVSTRVSTLDLLEQEYLLNYSNCFLGQRVQARNRKASNRAARLQKKIL